MATSSAVPAPLDERQALETAVAKDPRNPGLWLDLIACVRRGADVDDMRDVYDRFLEYFPQASAQWIEFVNMEQSQMNWEEVNAIFTRSLRTTPSLDLWKVYLAYVRRVNPLPPFTPEENSPRDQTRHILEDSYEFALKHIGWDRVSGPIWQDYLQLIREREARGAWQEGQKMDQLRRVFQRAVSTPLDHVEAIWKEYDAYENSLNKLTAKKFLGERSPAYMQARAVLREMKHYTDVLAYPSLPVLPPWIDPNVRVASKKERSAFEAWHKYLKWEESNPLAFDDKAALQQRVLHAYRKATMYMRFDAVVWYMAAEFCRATQLESEMLIWLRDGIEACPWSLLLRFAYAEASHAQQRDADAAAALDDLLEYAQHQIDARLQTLADAKTRVDEHMATKRKQQLDKRAQLDSVPDDDDADKVELADMERQLHDEREQQHRELEKGAEAGLAVWRNAVTQAWIKYMHFVRRCQGIRAMRQIFSRARKSPHCAWQVYQANAMLEYHCAKEPLIATKVFELALKTFGPNEHLVVHYLDFLLSINDDANARAVLERTVGSLAPERAKLVWDRWAQYEYSYGDANGIARLDARMADLYPERTAVQAAADRLQYEGLDWVRARDLGMAAVATEKRKPKEESKTEAKDDASSAGTGTGTGTSANVSESASANASANASASTSASAEPSATAPGKGSSGGRQTMEDIRRSLAANAEPVKRTRKEAEKPAKKTKSASETASARKGTNGARDTPPPMPTIPDAILYFMSLLPHAMTYDGPPIPPDAIFECLARSSLPLLPAYPDARRPGKRR